MINTNDLKVISHRGLTNGPSKLLENDPKNILKNISTYPSLLNEVDVNLTESGIFLGHDNPTYELSLEFLIEHKEFLILHIKFIQSNSNKIIDTLEKLNLECHIFSHFEDPFALTNKGWIWSHPNQGIRANTILVMPERIMPISNLSFNNQFRNLRGVCTDYPLKMID